MTEIKTQSNLTFVKPTRPFWVYLLECTDGSLYCGIALDIDARFAQHMAGTGAAYTRSHKPVRVVCGYEFQSRSLALKAEIAVKKIPKLSKAAYLHGLAYNLPAYTCERGMVEESKN